MCIHNFIRLLIYNYFSSKKNLVIQFGIFMYHLLLTNNCYQVSIPDPTDLCMVLYMCTLTMGLNTNLLGVERTGLAAF